MWFRKNIYSWEQVLRILASLGMILFGAMGAWGTPRGYGLVAGGIALFVTGLVGYCPACAMLGRTIRPKEPSR